MQQAQAEQRGSLCAVHAHTNRQRAAGRQQRSAPRSTSTVGREQAGARAGCIDKAMHWILAAHAGAHTSRRVQLSWGDTEGSAHLHVWRQLNFRERVGVAGRQVQEEHARHGAVCAAAAACRHAQQHSNRGGVVLVREVPAWVDGVVWCSWGCVPGLEARRGQSGRWKCAVSSRQVWATECRRPVGACHQNPHGGRLVPRMLGDAHTDTGRSTTGGPSAH